MDRAELQALQAPLKERYREDPERRGRHADAPRGRSATGVACSVDTGRALAEAGLHPATGGDGALAVLGRHAARGAGRLRGRHAARGGHRRSGSR